MWTEDNHLGIRRRRPHTHTAWHNSPCLRRPCRPQHHVASSAVNLTLLRLRHKLLADGVHLRQLGGVNNACRDSTHEW